MEGEKESCYLNDLITDLVLNFLTLPVHTAPPLAHGFICIVCTSYTQFFCFPFNFCHLVLPTFLPFFLCCSRFLFFFGSCFFGPYFFAAVVFSLLPLLNFIFFRAVYFTREIIPRVLTLLTRMYTKFYLYLVL